MSLPDGVVSRPRPTAPDPRAARSVLRIGVAVVAVALPWLVYSAAIVPGLRLRHEQSRLEREIIEARQRRRALEAERARLLDPRRLRREAARLGLSEPPPSFRPRRLESAPPPPAPPQERPEPVEALAAVREARR